MNPVFLQRAVLFRRSYISAKTILGLGGLLFLVKSVVLLGRKALAAQIWVKGHAPRLRYLDDKREYISMTKVHLSVAKGAFTCESVGLLVAVVTGMAVYMSELDGIISTAVWVITNKERFVSACCLIHP
jgi:hypothetical protein